MKLFTKITVGFSFAVISTSCGTDNTTNNNITPQDNSSNTNTVVAKPHVVPPDFNSDSAYSYIAKQSEIGPRVPGSEAHKQAIAYYQSFFKNLGAEVMLQGDNVRTFDNKQWRIDNVIATFNPHAKTRILLTSHYDSRPFSDKDPNPDNRNKPCPGINDGASGVGIIMEIARQINLKMPSVGIDVVLFDLEDYGVNQDSESWALGSKSWAQNPHKRGYKAKYGILLDMVGAKNAVFPREAISVFHANDVVNKIWNAAAKLGYGNYFIDAESGEMTDDHVAINKVAEIPCVDILHYDLYKNEFFQHHHTSTDDLNTIDKNTLKAVGQTLLEVIYNEE